MTQNITLVTQKPFGSLTCNFYKDDAIENEFYMTRRQIGEALGYVKADDAIQQIHNRNNDRLDPLSTTLTLGGVEGNRWVNRNTRVYTLRGVMEICRFSTLPGGFSAQLLFSLLLSISICVVKCDGIMSGLWFQS